MVIKKFSFLLLAVSLTIAAYSQAPDGYYSSASGKNKAALKTALYEIVHNHTEKSYNDLWTAFMTTDKRPDGKVWDIYSDIPNGTPQYLYTFHDNQCGTYSGEGNCYNREHSFPKSWFGDATPMYTDLFHLYPTDGYVNGKRSNYPYGEVGIASFTSSNGSKLGQCAFAGYTGTVFEPIDEYKGDLARTYFYMATCYEDKIGSWAANAEAQPLLAGNAYPAFKEWTINLLLKWSRQDPVSQKEIDRNNAIYGIQGNRNPYIDHPELVEYIWGNKTSEIFILNQPAISLTPSGSLDFGKNIPGSVSYKTINVKTYNTTGDLVLSLSGAEASKFTLSTSTISYDEALAGKDVVVTYLSNVVGVDSATLTISGGGAAPAILNLSGQTSNEFIALPATETTSSSFKANWTKSDNATGYILDVYQKTESGSDKQVVFDYDLTLGLPTAWTKLEGYAQLDGEALRMASGSQNGIVKSEIIGTYEESVLTINAKQYGSDAGAAIYVNVGNTPVDTIYTTTSYKDYSVAIPSGNGSSSITLSANKKNRVYVSSVTLETLGKKLVKTSLIGFPVTLNNIISFVVSNLDSNSDYYYTVTPIGGYDPQSVEIKATTGASSSSIDLSKNEMLKVTKTYNGFLVKRNSGSTKYISVFDAGGKLVKLISNPASSLFVPFNRKGNYIISVDDENGRTSFKLLF